MPDILGAQPGCSRGPRHERTPLRYKSLGTPRGNISILNQDEMTKRVRSGDLSMAAAAGGSAARRRSSQRTVKKEFREICYIIVNLSISKQRLSSHSALLGPFAAQHLQGEKYKGTASGKRLSRLQKPRSGVRSRCSAHNRHSLPASTSP